VHQAGYLLLVLADGKRSQSVVGSTQGTDSTSQLVISFLASANGPLQPSNKINYPDIYVGIPSILICIEMAFFAVLHIFAFPYKPYDLARSTEAVPLKYKGALWAFADAFNPWDIIKASARGFRWLFVGVRQRHMDESYQTNNGTKVGTMDGYTGPLHAGNGSAATELRPSNDDRRQGRDSRKTTDLSEDDRQGLLHNPAGPGRREDTSPYKAYSNDEYAPGDDSAQLSSDRPGRHGGYGEHDTGYHGAAQSSDDTLRQDSDPNWNVWGGAGRMEEGGSLSRPPTYSTRDER
jgi:hypothetical protein